MNEWRELKLITKAVADVARLTIVYHLARHHEMTVTALTGQLDLSQPLVSWHLRKLRKAGLVRTRREGRQVYCTLDLARYQSWLARMEHLTDPQVHLEQPLRGAALAEAELGLES